MHSLIPQGMALVIDVIALRQTGFTRLRGMTIAQIYREQRPSEEAMADLSALVGPSRDRREWSGNLADYHVLSLAV